jgi:hypothetical protein
LLHDAKLEVIGSQMPPSVNDSRDTTMGGKVEDTARKYKSILKRKEVGH